MSIQFPYRILAVDPATTKSGWAILDLVSLSPFVINIVAHAQVDGDKLVRHKKEMAIIFPRQFCTLDALEDEYERIISLYNPNIVVSESAFGYTHMSAFLALSLAIHTLRRVSKKMLNKNIVEVPPTITKIAFTGTGKADKDHMRLAYQTHAYLHGKVPDGNLISEHEIDAVAHGVGHIKRDITFEVTQISAKEKKRLKREKLEKKKQKENT